MKNNKIKVFLAAPRGFCAGVDRAIEIVKKSLNKYGSLDKLQQNGWEIDYRQYRVFNGVMLPVQIIFYNKSKQLRIKLVIQNWGF